ncbi:MAG: hypothetical protein ABW168_29115 [Sedimenticola sp.]
MLARKEFFKTIHELAQKTGKRDPGSESIAPTCCEIYNSSGAIDSDPYRYYSTFTPYTF